LIAKDFNRSKLASPAGLSYIIELSIGLLEELVNKSPQNKSPVAVRIHIEPDE
jgi:hypothetical protein